jgi:DNA helicase-2/ATP-dependent DNA helicase PcrA
MFKPRPKQQEVLDYTKGKMGVSAVPGSGKTRTLSYLAAKLVADGYIKDDQEVLVVTLVNSAVDNFARQVAGFVKERGLLPGFGYRVRTLHGLSGDIVRERPSLVGLSDSFQIIDERDAEEVLEDAASSWVRLNTYAGDEYFDQNLAEGKLDWVRRDQWPQLVIETARNFIKQAKDWQMSPDDVKHNLDRFGVSLPLAEMGWHIYVNYQRGLAYRGAVDFQDLIWLALKVLVLDDNYRQRLSQQWPYVLEDEAQDSSELQERILRILVGDNGNWVRVGDPNQAIYETFTTASPEFLRRFMKEKGVQARTLPNSGRSSRSIINLANHLIDWTQTKHSKEIRDRQPLQPPHIEPTPPDDPQPNPIDDPTKIRVYGEKLTSQEEIELVAKSLAKWLPEHPDETAAVLVPRNDRGSEVVKALQARKLETVELLRSTSSTREAAGALANILIYLSEPNSANALATVYTVWRRDDREDPIGGPRLQRVVKLLKACRQVEDYIWPGVGQDWLDTAGVTELTEQDDVARTQLIEFRELVRRWQAAVVLPIDQLILTLAQDLFHDPIPLAIAHTIALTLGHDADTHLHWRLPEFADELRKVARNQRRIIGLTDEGGDFDPDLHKGKVTVATMHRAKGLEWDRVYLLSVNNYDFPSAQIYDQSISEKWFLRDGLNLEAEALAQLESLKLNRPYDEGKATREARIEYACERLRLLYVGITRARKELILTWNTGRDGSLQPALPFVALQSYWEEKHGVTS